MDNRQKIRLAAAAVIFIAVAGLIYFFHETRSRNITMYIPRSETAEGTKEDPQARAHWEWLRLRDPKTGFIPRNIGSREMAFARRMPHPLAGRHVPVVKDWTGRGPVNIGGRTKAMALDVRDEKVILAGGVSSGM